MTTGFEQSFRTTEGTAIQEAWSRAEKAYEEWRDIPLKERLSYMKNMQSALNRNLEDWVSLLCTNAEKVPMDALTSDLLPTLSALSYYRKRAKRILKRKRAKTPFYAIGEKAFVENRPLGIVTVFSPWNFPVQLSLIPVICALIAGNVVILKPSEWIADAVIQKMRDLFRDAGFPDGVVQVVKGGAELGKALIEHKPAKVFFTGGYETGKQVLEQASSYMIPCDLELSGKDPMIILDDVNLRRAAKAAVWGAFFNGGQVCVGIERVYVHQSVYREFIQLVLEETSKLRMGIDVVSVLNERVFQQALRQLEDALDHGAKMLTGGVKEFQNQLTFFPTVITDVHHQMRIMTDETFAPIMPILPFTTDEEAITLANESSFGLNASVFSNDLNRANRIANALESGNCYINNVVTNISNLHVPFGGVKQSGMGFYHSSEGLTTFTRPYSITINTGKRGAETNWYPYQQRNHDFLMKLIRFIYR